MQCEENGKVHFCQPWFSSDFGFSTLNCIIERFFITLVCIDQKQSLSPCVVNTTFCYKV